MKRPALYQSKEFFSIYIYSSQEELFKPTLKIDKVSAMNNFEFSKDGLITVHRQYKIGPGKVCLNFI